MNFDIDKLHETAKGWLKTATAGAKKAATTASHATDKAAQVMALKCTELTGREVTATQVKQAAITAGIVVAGVAAAATIASVAGQAIAAGTAQAGRGRRAGGDRWGGDFNDQAAGIFAEHGRSLNYYTPHVDSEGQVYSG